MIFCSTGGRKSDVGGSRSCGAVRVFNSMPKGLLDFDPKCPQQGCTHRWSGSITPVLSLMVSGYKWLA